MKRSPLESQDDRMEQRRVLENPDEDEVRVGEVQVNEAVEHPRSEVANKKVIKTRWVLKPQGEGVKARFVMKHFNTWKDENDDFYAGTPTPTLFNLVLALAAKRVAPGKSQTSSVSQCFHCVSSCGDER